MDASLSVICGSDKSKHEGYYSKKIFSWKTGRIGVKSLDIIYSKQKILIHKTVKNSVENCSAGWIMQMKPCWIWRVVHVATS